MSEAIAKGEGLKAEVKEIKTSIAETKEKLQEGGSIDRFVALTQKLDTLTSRLETVEHKIKFLDLVDDEENTRVVVQDEGEEEEEEKLEEEVEHKEEEKKKRKPSKKIDGTLNEWEGWGEKPKKK